MRVLRYRLRRGSGGAGLYPGGEGIERDLLMLEDVTVSLITERRVSAPWGLAGGASGAVGENWLLPGGDESEARPLPDKCTVQLAAGDVLRMLTPGGGGWGPAPGSGSGLTVLGGSDASLVRIADYDPRWAERFEMEGSRIAAALGSVARSVDHVGSTAVPGLAAKPIVDIAVGVDEPDDDATFLVPLTRAGYVLRVIEPGHRMFRSPQHDVHVHVWREGSDDQREQLVFRDQLRANEQDRLKYESVKRELASRAWESMQEYAEAKTDVVREIMSRARNS